MSDVERIPNTAFGSAGADDANLPGQNTPQLEYYQTSEGGLRIEEAEGTEGAWIGVGPGLKDGESA